MKHAGAPTLAQLADLLGEVRKLPQLREKSPGSFYLKSKAYLHFHEDPAGIFADVKLDLEEFTRTRATTANEQKSLLAKIAKSLKAHS